MIRTRYWELVTDPDPRVRKYIDNSDLELTIFVIGWTLHPERYMNEFPPTYAQLKAGEL